MISFIICLGLMFIIDVQIIKMLRKLGYNNKLVAWGFIILCSSFMFDWIVK